MFRMRNLAQHLRERGLPFILLVNDHAPALDVLRQEQLPFEVVELARAAQWVPDVVRRHAPRLWLNDRLDTDLAHAQAVKTAGVALATIEDRGEGATLADLHIASLVFTGEPLAGRRVLRGLDYLILNPEIARHRRARTEARSLLVTLGGTDTYGATVKAVALLRKYGRPATVIIGPGFMHQEALRAELTADFTLKVGVPSMIEEMSQHDLAITGGGVTSFEAAASGLPVIAIANEWFEVPMAQHLASLGAARFAGHHSALDESAFAAPPDIAAMSAAGLAHVPLHGTERVCQALLELA
ncbi:MAG: putative glycosyltransferase [Betaproteobacteria bacterium]|nr:putative glycosyltransferase [Betaproteobacteria bacterium]